MKRSSSCHPAIDGKDVIRAALPDAIEHTSTHCDQVYVIEVLQDMSATSASEKQKCVDQKSATVASPELLIRWMLTGFIEPFSVLLDGLMTIHQPALR